MGRELIRRIRTFPCDDHYRPSNATWARDLYTFSGSLMGKTRENDEVRHNMTQIASLLAVATICLGYGLYYLHFTVREGGGAYTRDRITYAGT